jgi:regulatory protein
MVRDRGLPGQGGRKARGGASGRKRGTAHLVLVPEPGSVPQNGDEHPSRESVAADSAEAGSRPEPRGARRGGADPGDSGSGAIPPGGVHSPRVSPELGAEHHGGEEAARAICLRLLTSAPRTRAQLATALRKRRIPDEVAESVLGRFAEVGLIDDAAFARAWVESRHHGRGLARRALRAELRQRGVPDGDVRSAVGMLGPQDELDAARRLVARRVAASRGKPVLTRARQLMGMLARKGYPAGLAAQVVREALEKDQDDGPGPHADLGWISDEGGGDDWP